MAIGIVRAEETPLGLKRILSIITFKQALPWSYSVEEGIRTTLDSESPFPIELNIEHADQSRFPEEEYLRRIVDLYQYKYSKRKIDLVLAMGDESLELLLDYGGPLFGDTPVMLVTNDTTAIPDDLLKPNTTSLSWGVDFDGTLKYIRGLLPQTRDLFVISGTSTTDRGIRISAEAALGKLEAQWNIHHLSEYTAADLLEKVAHLPEDSAIYFLTVFRDGKGEYFVPRDLMSAIAHRANAPMFGIVDTYLGHGIVGGSLTSAQNRGKRIARVAIKLLGGGSLNNEVLKGNDSFPMFDWRQLKRWSISERKLPPGSIVRYRKPSIWEDHKEKIVVALVIVLAQAFALIYLLTQRRQRRLAQEESQQLRDELAHVSRVLTMGEITASLAHEINQPLTAIQSYAQAAQRFLKGELTDLAEVRKSLDGIITGNRRAKSVIQRIRMILDKEPLERKPLRVKELIDDVIMLVQRNADEKKIDLQLDLARGLPRVFGDRTQLQQVLLNLIINGFEAMGNPGSGTRKLVVQTIHDEPACVRISVCDSGIGIDDAHKDQLFDAFFTTKGDGLGMGLSISRSIIEDHGGRLWATKNGGGGATFSFTVPIYVEN